MLSVILVKMIILTMSVSFFLTVFPFNRLSSATRRILLCNAYKPESTYGSTNIIFID